MMHEGQAWFPDAGFGMFIHWSHVAQAGLEMSWPLVGGFGDLLPTPEISVADYYDTALRFAPEPGAAKEWAALARDAGMQYAVLTTKHHDGFALWPSDHSDFTIRESAYTGEDLVAEYVEAFRSAGLRIGFYFSLSDWHHPDYPAFTDDDRPYLRYLGRRSDPDAWARYRADMVGQLEELLTRYGTIDLLWFDGQWERTAEEWGAEALAARLRELQPGIVINDRLPGGDYATPEQGVPAEVPDGPWETCMTMNRSWGYVPEDDRYLTDRAIVHTLLDIVSKGGNLLLNVSPRADGSLPPEQVARLESVERWMAINGSSIVGAGPGLEPWQFYGPTTRGAEGELYLHLVMRPYESVTVRGLPIKRVRSARVLGSDRPLSFHGRAPVAELMSGPDPIGEVTIAVPGELVDEVATVIALSVDGVG